MTSPFISVIQSDRGPLKLQFNDGDSFRRVCGYQSALDPIPDEYYHKWFNGYHRNLWNRRWGQGIFRGIQSDRPAMITDIGSGVGVQDLLTALYLPNTHFHLIDGNVMPPKDINDPSWTEKGDIIYNDWNVLIDGITSSGIDSKRFTVNHMSNLPWPESDLITSFYSWCFHYPTEVYLDQVLAALKTGGYLYLTVRMNSQDPTIDKISHALGSRPLFMNTYDRSLRNSHIVILDETVDYFYADCLWQRAT